MAEMTEKKRTLRRIAAVSVCSLIAAVLTFAATLAVSAYFSTQIRLFNADGSADERFRMGMELNTFFDMLNSGTAEGKVAANTPLGIVCTDVRDLVLISGDVYKKSSDENLRVVKVGDAYYYAYNSGAEWGSASNPYIVSKTNHLQNLYVLQNAGYFAPQVNAHTDTPTEITENDMPYFLVCTSVGLPAAIDGTDRIFEYIGNDEYPFIGYVGGAFMSGSVEIGGKISSQSVIYNLTVKTANADIDVGLFGLIGYIGDDSTASDNQFYGAYSTVRDLLLYDVSVSVADADTWDMLVATARNHLFSYSEADASVVGQLPHENHHIGILAGHVEYATVEYISVYYSSSDIPAIDVNLDTPASGGESANYLSVSGILGFVNRMNSTEANGKITQGGISNGDITMSGSGSSTGGGIDSGTGRGYVTAEYLYNNYYTPYSNGVGTKNTVSSSGKTVAAEEIWEYYADGASSVQYGPMIEVTSDGAAFGVLSENSTVTARLTSNGGVYTEARLSNSNVWTNFILAVKAGDGSVTYKDSYGNAVNSFRQTDLLIFNAVYDTDNTEKLCTEYVRSRILWGTSNTGMYYFHDGVFTFALSDPTDTIEDTWDNNKADTITLGNDNGDEWTTDSTGLANAVAAFIKPIGSADELNGSNDIFIVYKENGTYRLVTLAKSSNYTAGGGANAVTTDQTGLTLFDSAVKSKLYTSLVAGTMVPEGITSDELIAEWDDVEVLNLGAAENTISLRELKDMYQLQATWTAKESDNSYYEDDQTTLATEALRTNSQNAKYSLYVANSTSDTDLNSIDESGNVAGRYFAIDAGAAAVTDSGLSSAISSLNSTYFEDDWSTNTSSSASPLSGKITAGSQITQTERVIYDEYFFFWTERESALRFNMVYFYVDSSGNRTRLGTKECSRTNDSRFKSELYAFFSGSSASNRGDGLTLYTYTVNGVKKTLPFLYELDGSFYTTYERDTSVGYFVKGTSNKCKFTTQDTGASHYKLYFEVTARYNYILAELTASGISYKWLGTTSCSNVSKTGQTVASIANGNLGIYSGAISSPTAYKNYSLYSCSQGTGILITRYAIDGYWQKTLTANGINYTFHKPDGSSFSVSSGYTPVQNNVSLPSGMASPTYTANLAGQNFLLYACDGKLAVRVVNYALDGYILAQYTKNGVIYKLNGGTNLSSVSVFHTSQTAPLQLTLSNGTTSKPYNIYKGDGHLGILICTYDIDGYFRFGAKHEEDGVTKQFYLRLLYRKYFIGQYYSVGCFDDSRAADNDYFSDGISTPELKNDKNATVSFNSDGSCYISYTVNGTTRYLNYSTSGGYFNTSSSTSDTTKMWIYSVEGTRDINPGNSYIPVVDSVDLSKMPGGSNTFPADEYVLVPNSSLTSEANGQGETVANTTSNDPVYTLLSLEQLYSKDNGWKNSVGGILTKNDLHKRFRLTYEISWGTTVNIWNGNWNFGSGGINNATSIVAPIGSDGYEANIPRGCVAFKINSTADDSSKTYKIRVIVSIPTSAYAPGAEGYALETGEDYYFGLWQTEAAGASVIQSFEKSNSIEKFELPRSHPCNTELTADENEYIKVSLPDGDTVYRSYLNGGQILVAYTFDVSDAGVYVIGATNGPMTIVYFSVDSTASSGKDGTTSYKTGTVDFVYDNGTDGAAGSKIITVRDGDPSSDGNTDYSEYYYPTLALLYTDNAGEITSPNENDGDVTDGFANINQFRIFVRRSRADEASEINWSAQSYKDSKPNETGTGFDAEYIQFTPYALSADAINRAENSVIDTSETE